MKGEEYEYLFLTDIFTGINEELKARNQLLWVGYMNDIQQRAKEILLYEVIYA